jgi:hypothetical protein
MLTTRPPKVGNELEMQGVILYQNMYFLDRIVPLGYKV